MATKPTTTQNMTTAIMAVVNERLAQGETADAAWTFVREHVDLMQNLHAYLKPEPRCDACGEQNGPLSADGVCGACLETFAKADADEAAQFAGGPVLEADR